MSSAIRSILFAPANMPELIAKMPRANADVAIVDLEDGTPEPEKNSARGQAAEAYKALRADGWQGRMFVRTNNPRTAWFKDDVAWVLETGFDGISLPKVGSAEEIEIYKQQLEGHSGDRPQVILGIESGNGVINLESIFDAIGSDAVGAYFGGEDYATSIGGVRSESNIENLYPRARGALHAKMRGLSVFDQGVVQIRDEDRFRRECVEARGFGFTGKICVYPRQVELTHEMFQPTEEEVTWSRRLLSEYEKALADGIATPAIDGMMIDGPLVKRAEAIVELAEAAK